MQSEAKHTPGPWRILDPSSPVPHEHVRVVVGKGRTARDTVASAAAYRRAEECEANARLIAAAPDLLEALRVITSHAQETYPHFESERGQRDIAAALEAIRKATGNV